MGNSNSTHNLVAVDFHAPDTTNQLLRTHLSNQKLSDILKHSTLSSTSSITMVLTDEQKIYASLVNNKDHAIITRVWVAQCKIVGFGTQKNTAEGFRELYQLKHHKEAYYPLACCYYDQAKYEDAYHYFYLLRKESHFAQYRLALMLLHNQHHGDTSTLHQRHQKAFYYMKLAATNQNKYAQFILGFYYEHGIFVKRSIKVAKTWYERSASQGFAEAQTALGNLLMKQIDTSHELSEEAQLTKQKALDWLNKAKDQENASAFIRLGALHEEGTLVSKDPSFSIDCYKKAAEITLAPLPVSALAHYLIGINYRLGDLGLEQDYTIALKHLTLSADAGYVPALRALGLMYAEGIGAPQDKAKANDLFQKAASQGDIRSLGLIAAHQASSNRESTASAMILYEKAAKAGSLAAQLALAELLQHTGQHTLAFQWFQTAASDSLNTEQENKISVLDLSIGFISQRNTARLMVARYLYNGWGGVIRNRIRAFKEFESLSKAGFSDAHYWLAACYEEGVKEEDDDTSSYVVESNLERAYDIYMQSAEAGDVDGQFQVAYMMSNGIAITKNLEDALVWYKRAAEQGHVIAQLSVGMYYEYGLVTPIDLEEAKKWYQLSASNNETTAMVRLAKILIELEDIQDACHWLRKAIDRGNVLAMRELADLYMDGLSDESVSVAEQYKLAYDYYRQAAEKNDALSLIALSKFYEGSYEEEEGETVVPVSFEMAVQCLTKAEKLGCSTAEIHLADLYRRHNQIDEAMSIYARLVGSYALDSAIGMKVRLEIAKLVIFEDYGTESDQQRVYSSLLDIKESASNVNECPEVLEILGYCSENGIGTSLNHDKAVEFYIDCVNMVGNEKCGLWEKQRCLCRLVNIYMEEKNYNSAFTYLEALKPNLDQMSQLPFQDAASQAHRMRYYFGYLLLYGLGAKKSVQESITWLEDAADEGDGDAAYELGHYLHCQQELEKEAGSRYRQGVLAGHAGCMRELALLLLAEETDKSVLDEDYDGGTEIRDLLVSASELGDKEAMYRLGQAYEKGLGDIIPQRDITKALEYYTMAANERHEWAMIRVSEILGNYMNKHEEAIEWLQKASTLFASTKARVMLISYEFNRPHGSKDSRDAHNFTLLQSLIDQEIEMIKSTSIDDNNETTQREREERLFMKKSGLGLALYTLGQCYELGRGTTLQLSSAKDLYQRSVLISQNTEAMWRLGFIYHTVENNAICALEWFRKAAETGHHCDSHYQLGLFHLYGLAGLETNVIASKKHLSKAVDGGHPMATYELARLVWYHSNDYFYGYELYKVAGLQFHVAAALRELGHLSHIGFTSHGITIVDRDYKKAFALYCEAAQRGDPTAALMVGNYFEEGYLLKELGQDYERALQWYESAYRLNCGGLAELAIAKLKHILADTIIDEEEAEDIREEAIEWFESVANNSAIQYARPARIMMALYCINGWGRKVQDQEIGFEMLLKIAESGGFEALVPIAECYEQGIGTKKDMEKAVKYWEMSAEHTGDKNALLRLAEIYELGLTGKLDKDLADHYYHRAASCNLTKLVYSNKACSSRNSSKYCIGSSSL